MYTPRLCSITRVLSLWTRRWKMRKSVVLIIAAVLAFSYLPVSFAQYDEYIGKEVTLKSFEGKIPVYTGKSKRSFNSLTGTLMG